MEEKKWYVVNTYSGHENKVKEKLEMRAESMGLQDYIFRVIVPEQTVVEEKESCVSTQWAAHVPYVVTVIVAIAVKEWIIHVTREEVWYEGNEHEDGK